MSDVFALGGREEYGSLVGAEEREFPELDRKFEGVRPRWTPIDVLVPVGQRQRKPRPLGDIAYCFAWLPFPIAFSPRACEVLGPAVGASAEFLELRVLDGAKMYGVHVLDYRDHALDDANCRGISRFCSGEIQHIMVPAFHASKLEGATMFTLTHCGKVFVTEAISDLIEKEELKGFSFVRYQPR